jgi:hypothetical protein
MKSKLIGTGKYGLDFFLWFRIATVGLWKLLEAAMILRVP